MSKEYIEREVAISELECLPDQGELDYLGVFECVRSVPAADVAPVVHGEWVYDRWCEFKCSICGHWSNTLPRAQENFCPNCGADMRGVYKDV